MIDRNSRNFSFPGQLGVLLMLIGGGVIAGSLISTAVWVMMTGKPLTDLQNDMGNPAFYNALITLQAVTTFFLFFLPAWIFAMICYRRPGRFMGFETKINYRQVVWLMAILAFTFPLSGVLAEVARMIPLPQTWKLKFDTMEANRELQEAALIKINTFFKYMLSMVLIGILPAIFEEVLFRGVLQNFLTRWFKGPWAAILLTAFIFSIIHMSFYGFFVRFALGIILGYVFYYSGSLWLAILLHFLYNALQVTALYIFNTGETLSVREVEGDFPIWMGPVAVIFLWYAIKKFKVVSWKEQEKFEYREPEDSDSFQDWIAKNS